MGLHISQFANKLTCQHCGQSHGSKQWPINGDQVPFYYQKELGRYSLLVKCPNCNMEWYVVWDMDPGLIKSLDLTI